MNSSADSSSGSVALRPERPGDEPLLFEVYAGTRQAELALTNWDEHARRAFSDMQFAAMRRSYASLYPAGEFLIITVAHRAVGRMVLNRSAEELRVVDLALLPAHCNAGIGTVLMRRVCAQAAEARVPVRLCVLKSSRAVRWYERLGFAKTGEVGIYDQMEWRAPGC
jgi:ribosomal protein S18 acetylase RimI-like enzyme